MLRRLYSGSNLNRAQSLDDLRARAFKRLPNFCREYLEGGADDELTLKHNRQVYDKILFKPRMLVNITQRNLSTQVFAKHPHG